MSHLVPFIGSQQSSVVAASGSWRFLVFPVALIVSGWTAAGLAWDWPQWGGSDTRNMASDEKGIPAVFEPGKKKSDGSGIDLQTTRNVKWVAKLGSENYSSPVVVNGKVFIGTNDADLDDPRYKPTGGGVLLCLDEATGKRIWRLVVPKLLEGKRSEDFDDMHLGICSTPTVEGDRVYLVTNRCDVVCLDINGIANGNNGPFTDERHYTVEPGQLPVDAKPGDADIIWRFDMLNKLPVFPHDAACCSPLVYGDYVYVCTANGVADQPRPEKCPLPMSPSVIVLDKKTGRLVAKDDEMIGGRVYHGQWSSPSLGHADNKAEVFYGGGDGVCYAFEALTSPAAQSSGFLHKIWSFDCNAEWHVRDGKPVQYWEGDKRRDLDNHNDWTYRGLDEIIATPVFYKNRVYVAVGRDPLHGAKAKGELFCIDAGDIATAERIWSYEDVGRTLSTVSIADGLLYIADDAGRVHCLDAETGKLYWMYDTRQEIWSSTLVVDGKVYVGTRKDFVVLAAGRQEKLLAEIRLGSQVRSTPAVSDGVLYVASQRYLWAVEADKPHHVAGGAAQHKGG